jgi:1-aminocyclopropane-1-carboxylate deaminase/D-cysteine desulfhydrase-like pyridoxal-dependent ACC family enzyme
MGTDSFVIPLQHINDTITQKFGVNLYMLRTDLNHQHISGNKLFKLKYNLVEARNLKKSTLLTFGGAFSNHIAATAAAGKEQGFKTIGIIRGDKTDSLNPTLRFAVDQGMSIHFISREDYRKKHEKNFLNDLQSKFPEAYIIPEGGANEAGVKGCMEITDHIKVPFDVICCACGTGATLAGIILALQPGQGALGFQVLKGENYIRSEVSAWLDKFNSDKTNWTVNEDYHFGGYAKRTPELINFVEGFEKQHSIPLDFIYTGKMMFGIYDLMPKGYFKKGQTIIVVHTGGLQGNQGFQ